MVFAPIVPSLFFLNCFLQYLSTDGCGSDQFHNVRFSWKCSVMFEWKTFHCTFPVSAFCLKFYFSTCSAFFSVFFLQDNVWSVRRHSVFLHVVSCMLIKGPGRMRGGAGQQQDDCQSPAWWESAYWPAHTLAHTKVGSSALPSTTPAHTFMRHVSCDVWDFWY